MATAKGPTTSEVRKAFREAMDAVSMPSDTRKIALEVFKDNLRPSAPQKRLRRQEQNQALHDVLTLAELMPQMLDEAIHVIKRNDFDSGQRHHLPGELADMEGTPAPYYGDPTGEAACWGEMSDRTGTIITAMCEALGQWLTIAQNIHELSSIDVTERAKRTVPDCMACGDPCLGRVLSGFDEKCYRRWTRSGRPDRLKFIHDMQAEKRISSDDPRLAEVDEIAKS